MSARLVLALVLVALGVVSLVGIQLSGATYSATKANPGNTFTASNNFACSSPGSQTVIATNDTWLDQSSPSSSGGGTDAILKLQSKNAQNFRVMVKFSLPSVPSGCVVTSATLNLYATSAAAGRTLEAYQLAATPAWTDSTANWSNQPAMVGSPATTTSGTGLRSWTVTTQVQAMYSETNNGFLLKDSAENDPNGKEQLFYAAIGTTDTTKKPRLSVTWE